MVTALDESMPVAEFSVIVGGKVPDTTENVVAPPAPPVVAICVEYVRTGEPESVRAFGRVVVVMSSGPPVCRVSVTDFD